MRKLYAVFKINLPTRVLVRWPDDQSIDFRTAHGSFDVELKLLPQNGPKGKQARQPYWTKFVDKISIKVGQSENEKVPDIIINEKGNTDLSKRSPYFDERLPEYRSVAFCIYKRFIKYFKYVLKNPLLDELKYREEDFANPIWFDENGSELRSGTIKLFSKLIPGMSGDEHFGIRSFSPDLKNDFEEGLEKDLTPLLHQEILVDAQSAILEDNFRRGILEMAIACELAVKQLFFTKTTPAGSAFEYLEDKGKVQVTVLEFISRVSEDAFGVSFKTESPEDY